MSLCFTFLLLDLFASSLSIVTWQNLCEFVWSSEGRKEGRKSSVMRRVAPHWKHWIHHNITSQHHITTQRNRCHSYIQYVAISEYYKCSPRMFNDSYLIIYFWCKVWFKLNLSDYITLIFFPHNPSSYAAIVTVKFKHLYLYTHAVPGE